MAAEILRPVLHLSLFEMPSGDNSRKNGGRRASSNSGDRDSKKDKKKGRRSPPRTRSPSRSPSPGAQATLPPAYPTSSDLQVAALMAAIEGVKQSNAQQYESLDVQVRGLASNVDNKVQKADKKGQDVANKSDAMDERVAVSEENAKKPHDSLSWPVGSSGIHPLAHASSGVLPSEGFDHAHSPKVMPCNAHDDVQFTKPVATDFFKQVLAEEGLDFEFEVGGQYELGKKFNGTFQRPGIVPVARSGACSEPEGV